MPTGAYEILASAREGLTRQEEEISAVRSRQPLAVFTKTATGNGDIDNALGLDRKFRLVFVRCHFAGGSGKAPLTVSVDSAAGAEYDARLFTIAKAGAGRDVNFRLSAEESAEPSPWTFQAGDAVRVQWSNPDAGNIIWGLEVGLAIAT